MLLLGLLVVAGVWAVVIAVLDNFRKRRRGRRGQHALLALELVVIAAPVVAGAVFLVGMMGMSAGKVRINATREDMRRISEAIQDFAAKHGGYPNGGSVEEIERIVRPDAPGAFPRRDSWRTDYRYACWSDEPAKPCNHFALVSAGEDGRFAETDLRTYKRTDRSEDLVIVDGEWIATPFRRD